MTKIGEERVFILHRPTPDAEPAECVYLSQRDVRELQFAKAAISTGWTLLLEELGLEHRDVQQVLLAGSFGSYLSPASAVRIGLVPQLPVLRIVAAGNVAGEGAKMALLSVRERAGAHGAAGGGDLCRALRPPRLQRQVRRPAQLLSRPADRIALIACGAIAQPAAEIAAAPRLARRRTPAAAAAAQPAAADRRRGPRRWPSGCSPAYDRVAVGYADCGTYGALDEVCDDLGIERLPGPALLRRVRRPGAARARSSRSSPAPTCSPTSWSGRSRAP